jgi:hypothetical protein
LVLLDEKVTMNMIIGGLILLLGSFTTLSIKKQSVTLRDIPL